MTHLHDPAKNRRGAILAAALLAFFAATAILFAVLQSVVSHHRQLRNQLVQLQAQSLAQAGVERALAQLRATNAYHGETWKIPAEELNDDSNAAVEILVEAVSDHPNDRHIQITAAYPDDPIHRAQQSRELIVHLK
jgi:Tfp pilus assembly protein PilX